MKWKKKPESRFHVVFSSLYGSSMRYSWRNGIWYQCEVFYGVINESGKLVLHKKTFELSLMYNQWISVVAINEHVYISFVKLTVMKGRVWGGGGVSLPIVLIMSIFDKNKLRNIRRRHLSVYDIIVSTVSSIFIIYKIFSSAICTVIMN